MGHFLNYVVRVTAGAAFAALTSLPALAELAPSIAVPIHGVILRQVDATHVLAAINTVTQAHEPRPTLYGLERPRRVQAGLQFDAILQQGILHDVMRSEGYTAGIPDARTLSTIAVGEALPAVHVIDQQSRIFDLSKAWLGKTVVLSFIFTRCPDALICPAISGKFAYLQDHLDAARTHLVEITLDPKYDLPSVTHAYAVRFGALPDQWSILTGEQNQIGFLISRFGLSNLENRPGNFEHDDTLAIVGPNGRISDIIPTGGWTPDDVIATVLHEQGDETNPLRRLELTAIAGVVSLCGGSATTGQVVLDSIVFVGGVLFFGGLLFFFGKRIWLHEPDEKM